MLFNAKILITVVASALIATVTAQEPLITCYNSDGLIYDCRRFINQFCAHAVASNYDPYDNMSRCFNNGSGNRCDLTVWLDNPDREDRVPSEANCKATLLAASNQCRAGGFGRLPNRPFRFAIDANFGQCGGDSNRVANAARANSAAAAATAA